MANHNTYIPFGKSAGMFVSLDDMKYRPLSVSRCTYCWIGEDEKIAVFDWKSGAGVNIPMNIWFDLLKEEKDKETGVDLIKRVKDITFKE